MKFIVSLYDYFNPRSSLVIQINFPITIIYFYYFLYFVEISHFFSLAALVGYSVEAQGINVSRDVHLLPEKPLLQTHTS